MRCKEGSRVSITHRLTAGKEDGALFANNSKNLSEAAHKYYSYRTIFRRIELPHQVCWLIARPSSGRSAALNRFLATLSILVETYPAPPDAVSEDKNLRPSPCNCRRATGEGRFGEVSISL